MNRISRIVLTGALGIVLLGGAARGLPTAIEPGVGDPITLSAEHGEVVEVTPLQVIDPVQPVSSAAPPTTGTEPQSGSTEPPTTGTEPPSSPSGSRLIAVKFRLTNVGSAVYKDEPIESAALIDSNGVGYPGIATAITAGPTLSGTTTLNPRASKVGFVVFELPDSARATQIQFAMDSGLALQYGKWLIK